VSTQGSGGATVTAVRGHAVSFTGDPFLQEDVFVDIEDALIV